MKFLLLFWSENIRMWITRHIYNTFLFCLYLKHILLNSEHLSSQGLHSLDSRMVDDTYNMNTNYLHFRNTYFRLDSTKLTSQLLCPGLWYEFWLQNFNHKIIVKENMINGCYNLECQMLPHRMEKTYLWMSSEYICMELLTYDLGGGYSDKYRPSTAKQYIFR